MAQVFHLSQFRPLASAVLRPPKAAAASRGLPARDRVIDFGKHKGRMLGSLPSSYLKWVSGNLRARDFEEWARLADEVLADPVYRDRLEWEAAERVLVGVEGGGAASRRGSETPVSELVDISERFGWDNEDKDAWARLDFELLGTSKGGRIPRLQRLDKEAKGQASSSNSLISGHPKPTLSGTSVASSLRNRRPKEEEKGWVLNADMASTSNRRLSQIAEPKKDGSLIGDSKTTSGESASGGRKVVFLSRGHEYIVGEGEGMAMATKGGREERREMRRWKREQQMERLKREVGLNEGKHGRNGEISEKKTGMVAGSGEFANPFP